MKYFNGMFMVLAAVVLFAGCTSNQPPSASAGPDQTVNVGENVTLLGCGSDLDGKVTYRWEQTAGDSVSISNDSAASASFVAPDVGSPMLTFRLTVTDDANATATDEVTVTISVMAVKPSERGHIRNEKDKYGEYKHDLSAISNENYGPRNKNKEKHLQGIARAGDEYTVLSSSVNDKALILVYQKQIDQKQIVDVEELPFGYDHAGGIDVLDVKNGWMIVVPVFKGDQGAILRYFLPEGNGAQARLRDHTEIIQLSTKAYVAGIARTQNNSVVIAVVIDDDGNQVQFWMCNNRNGQGQYKDLGVWDATNVDKSYWKPDKNWARYPNSISLIEHGGQIYFVGLNGPAVGIGRDWVDIYLVNLDKNAGDRRLIKVDNAHVECDDASMIAQAISSATQAEIISTKNGTGPSFRWGGSAWIQGGILEVLAVGYGVHNNSLIDYNKFRFDINAAIHLNPI